MTIRLMLEFSMWPRAAVLFLVFGCSGQPAGPVVTCDDCTPPVAPLPDFRFERIAETPLEDEPEGIALSPDGRFLAVGAYRGSGVHILDAETYQPVRERIPFSLPWGIAFAEDGSQMAVATKQGGVYGLSFPSAEIEFMTPFRARNLIAGPGGPYYALGLDDEQKGAVIRIDRAGRIAARYPLIGQQDPFGLAVSRDGRFILAHDYGGRDRLLALTVPDLNLHKAIAIPISAWTIIPLERNGRALLLGAEGGFASTLVGVVVDYETGETGPLQHAPTLVQFLVLGYGSPWADIGNDAILVPTSDGTLIIDARDGKIVRVIRDLEPPYLVEYTDHVQAYNTPCCEALYDPQRRRMMIAHRGYGPPSALYVYSVHP